jgi:hypothetical protein
MQTLRDNYLTAYRNLKLTRDAEGVLVAQFHNNGGPLTFTAEAHTEVVDAFYRISQDRANKIVILTGGGRGLHDRCGLVVFHRRFRSRRMEPNP